MWLVEFGFKGVILELLISLNTAFVQKYFNSSYKYLPSKSTAFPPGKAFWFKVKAFLSSLVAVSLPIGPNLHHRRRGPGMLRLWALTSAQWTPIPAGECCPAEQPLVSGGLGALAMGIGQLSHRPWNRILIEQPHASNLWQEGKVCWLLKKINTFVHICTLFWKAVLVTSYAKKFNLVGTAAPLYFPEGPTPLSPSTFLFVCLSSAVSNPTPL